jgi:putative tricarboxylic transport membrane protein
MRKRDLISGLFCCGLGVIFCVGATKYGLIRSGIPVAGFFPFIAGATLICLSLVMLFSSIRSKKKLETINNKFFARRDSWIKVVLALCGLFGYAIGIEYLGFLITTFLLIVFLLKVVEPQRWLTILPVSLLSPTLSYIIFELLLDIHLPKGILGL